MLGADASPATRPHDSGQLRGAWHDGPSGMVCVKACLRPDDARCCFRVLQQAETRSITTTTARRPYNRADGLMALVHGYARGSSVERSPIELIVTVPVALLQQPAATTDSATSTTDSAANISATTDASHRARLLLTDRGASLPLALTVEADLALSPQATRRLACDCGVVVATIRRSNIDRRARSPSAARPALSPPPSRGHSCYAIAPAASPAAITACSSRATTCSTGPTAARPA
ncbi:MAG: hypothetical protein IPI49_30680 [Myxococcales bacterium]|nr:hypothetical protein [Myxococcales bacterium]